jgi:4-amino-4-deoxy-L-arabinose transferase-like glycosyltransferase
LRFLSKFSLASTDPEAAAAEVSFIGFCAMHRLIILICLAAFALRLAYRIVTGSEEFWSNSYSFYYTVTQNLVAGRGLGLGVHGIWMVQAPPVYPLLLVPAVLQGGNYLCIVIPQAVIGAGTVLCAFLIGRELFDQRAGLIAAALTAIYPYYLVHDTALQETGLLTFCLAMSVWLLLRAARASATPHLWLIAGAMLGVSMMVRTTAMPFALSAVIWLWLFGAGSPGRRTRRALTVLGCIALVAGGWITRNAEVTGRPVMSGGSGYSFWAAHNPQTFSHYPTSNIEVSIREAFSAFSVADWKNLEALKYDGARDDWFLARGRAYLSRQPLGEKLIEAGRKILAGFSWVLTPHKQGLTQWVYFLSYTPILFLGLAGMVLTGRDWRRHSLIYSQFAIFVAISAALWAHTSYRTPLDVYLMIFAAALLNRLRRLARP